MIMAILIRYFRGREKKYRDRADRQSQEVFQLFFHGERFLKRVICTTKLRENLTINNNFILA
jgi:hypothetical protein